MTTTDSSQNDIISAWQNLIEKSVKANTTFLQESSKIFTDILSKKIETKDLLKINTEVLSAAANNLIKLNIANTENLVNFGIEVSKSFFSFSNAKNNTTTNSESNTETTAAKERSQINLAASQGQSLSTSFYLNSHNAFPQTGKFYYENFIDGDTGNKAAIAMSISPVTFTLDPGKSIKVDISLNVKKDVKAGMYKSTVKLDGMNNQEFDIVLEVLENKKELTVDSKTLPTVKKAAARKRINKKASSKK